MSIYIVVPSWSLVRFLAKSFRLTSWSLNVCSALFGAKFFSTRDDSACHPVVCLRKTSSSPYFPWFCLGPQAGIFFMVFMDEDVGRRVYNVSEKTFSCQDDAIRSAQKKTGFRSLLLNSCQVDDYDTNHIYVYSRDLSGTEATIEV